MDFTCGERKRSVGKDVVEKRAWGAGGVSTTEDATLHQSMIIGLAADRHAGLILRVYRGLHKERGHETGHETGLMTQKRVQPPYASNQTRKPVSLAPSLSRGLRHGSNTVHTHGAYLGVLLLGGKVRKAEVRVPSPDLPAQLPAAWHLECDSKSHGQHSLHAIQTAEVTIITHGRLERAVHLAVRSRTDICRGRSSGTLHQRLHYRRVVRLKRRIERSSTPLRRCLHWWGRGRRGGGESKHGEVKKLTPTQATCRSSK